jgi:BirA family biotin operon repressor/biotin-[acetyl-CoA-carboxylase] ligase
LSSFALGPIATSRGYRVFGFDEVGSTSTEAAKAAGAGDVGEVWFAALKQTAGRGRRGRAWETPSGNLAASLMIVPQSDPAVAATLGFVAGVALNRALGAVLPQGVVRQGIDGANRIALKWPNDVLADGAKLAGMLLEAHKRPDGQQAIVIGIGVNIVSAPQGLPYPATSLSELGVALSAETLFTALAEEWIAAYELWDGGKNIATVLRLWRDAAAGIGSEVAIAQDGNVVRGVFETIDDSGRLIVRSNDNSRIAITAGDVHFGVTASVRA